MLMGVATFEPTPRADGFASIAGTAVWIATSMSLAGRGLVGEVAPRGIDHALSNA